MRSTRVEGARSRGSGGEYQRWCGLQSRGSEVLVRSVAFRVIVETDDDLTIGSQGRCHDGNCVWKTLQAWARSDMQAWRKQPGF